MGEAGGSNSGREGGHAGGGGAIRWLHCCWAVCPQVAFTECRVSCTNIFLAAFCPMLDLLWEAMASKRNHLLLSAAHMLDVQMHDLSCIGL